MVQAGILAWLLPGAGHFYLGHRGLSVVFFIAISFAYFTGLAFGGIKSSINPYSNKWLFLSEMGIGGYTSVLFLINQRVGEIRPSELADPQRVREIAPAKLVREVSFFPESDVSQIYLATAGLLNVLAILDALSRAQAHGLPTYHRDLLPASDGRRGPP